MEKGETWGPKGAHDMHGFLVVEGVSDGVVTAYAMGGGIHGNMDLNNFLENYEAYSPERLAEMRKDFAESRVTIDNWDVPGIRGWLNGETWNGWEQPYFQREDLEAALDKGDIVTSTPAYVIEFDETVGSFVIVSTEDGLDIPEGFDRTSFVAEAKAEGGHKEFAYAGRNMVIDVAKVRTVEIDGVPTQTYRVGEGWVWSLSETPELVAEQPVSKMPTP